MASANYFQHASRPFMPDTPRLSNSDFYSDQFEKYTDEYYHNAYPQHPGYHGLGIRGIHTPTISEPELPRLATPPLEPDYVEDEPEQFKIPTPVDEDMMTMAHDRSRHRRAASRELREENQALKQIMFATSDLTSDDRRSRRSILSPRSMSYHPSVHESPASRSNEELRDSQDFWKICLMVRKMMARGDREEERQRLLTTPQCCDSCGTPVTPVVFTPSRSFEVLGAWKDAQMTS